jgi:hypothetical protein
MIAHWHGQVHTTRRDPESTADSERDITDTDDTEHDGHAAGRCAGYESRPDFKSIADESLRFSHHDHSDGMITIVWGWRPLPLISWNFN